MAFVYDTKAQAALGTGDPITLAYTCGAGTKLLVVAVFGANDVTRLGGPPTYNAVAMTQAGDTITGNLECTTELWYLVNPPTGSSYNVSVPNSGGLSIRLEAFSFTSTGGTPTLFGNTSTDVSVANPQLTINSVPDGSCVVSVLGSGYKDSVTGRSHTELYTNDEGAWVNASQYELKSGTGNTTHSFTQTSDDVAMIMAAWKETAAPLVVSPDAASCVAAKLDPTVVYGSMSITPAAASVLAVKVDPTLILSSTTATPAPASAIATKIDPTVRVTRYIHNIYELQAMEDDLTGFYILGNDIDASPANPNSGNWDANEWPGAGGFRPIGVDFPFFTGTLDGADHKITGLYINGSENGVGLICCILSAESWVKDLTIEGAEIIGTGLAEVAPLVGVTYSGAIENCHAVNCTVSGDTEVGGLIGVTSGASVTQCSSSGTLSCTTEYAGGLIGRTTGTAPVTFSFSTVDISAPNANYVGGLIGEIGYAIHDCYATGDAAGDNYVGGLIGNAGTITVDNCYSVGAVSGTSLIGGLIGNSTGSVTNSFWDTQTSGKGTSDGGTGKTTAEMKDDATFTEEDTVGLDLAWDFVGNPHDDVANNDYWDIGGFNGGYPFLAWQRFSQTISPSAASAIAARVNPTVINNVTLGPLAASCIAASVDPIVLAGGNVIVAPDPALSVATSVSPAVILGSLTIAPAAASCVASKSEPTILNNVMLSPAVASSVAASVNPTVVNNVTLSPAASSAVAGKVDPTVINDVTLAPAAGSAITGKTDPSILITPLYSRGAPASLPTDDADLANLFTGTEYANVETDDGTRVEQVANSGQYAIFEFKNKYTQQEQFSPSWNGQSSKAPSASTIYLQIYNRTTPAWETLASNNSANADTDFTLEGSKTTGLSDYFNANFEIACRVYQQVT